MAVSDDIRTYGSGGPGVSASALASAMMKEIAAGAIIKTATGDQEVAALNQIVSILTELNTNLVNEMQQVRDAALETAQEVRECCIKGNKSAKEDDKKEKSNAFGFKKMFTTMGANVANTLMKAIRTPSGPAGGRGPTIKPPRQGPTVASAAAGGAPPPRSGGGGGGAGGGGRPPTGYPDRGKGDAGMVLGAYGLDKLAKATQKLTEGLGVSLSDVFKGAFTENMEFITQIRKIRSETLDLAEDYEDVTEKDVKYGQIRSQIGYNTVVYEKELLKLSRKGMTMEMKEGKLQQRTLKDQSSFLKNSLHTSFMIGANAEQTVDMFGEWNRHLGLTNTQLGGVGRSMEYIAKTSGVSGDNLLDAAKIANNTIKKIQKFGGATEDTVASLIESTANDMKYGVEELGSELGDALSSFQAFRDADRGIKHWLVRSAENFGGPQMWGDINSGEAMKDEESRNRTFQALTSEATRTLRGLMADAGVDSKTIGETDITNATAQMQKLDQAQRAHIETTFKNIMNHGLGEIEKKSQSMVETMKTPMERLADMDKARAKLVNAGASADKLKEHDSKREGLENSIRMKQLTVFQRKTNEYANPAEALAAANKELAGKGMGGISSPDALVQSIVGSMKAQDPEAFTAALKEAKVSEADLLKAASGDADTRAFGNESLQAVQNILGTRKQEKDNPMLEAVGILKDINNTIKQWMASPLFAMGTKLIMGIIIASAALQSLSLIWGAMRGLGSMAGGLGRRMLGGGGGGMPGGGFGSPRMPGSPVTRGPHAPTPHAPHGPSGNPFAGMSGTMGRQAARTPMPAPTRAPARGKWGKLLWGAKTALSYAPEVIGTGLGAYGGYQASAAMDQDGETDWTEYAAGIGGGLGGMWAGRKAKNWYKGRGAGGAATAADAASMGGGMMPGMEGMPGYGSDCVPVCIVGGLPGFGGGGMGMGMGMMGAGMMAPTLMDYAPDLVMGGIDIAGDVKNLASAGKTVDTMTDVAKVADVAADAGKGTGIMSKMGGMLKSIPGVGKMGGVLSKAAPLLKGAGALGGKALPFLGPIIGAVTGVMEDDGSGRGGIEKALLGAATGGSSTGSMFSGMLGIEAGSAGDEALGIGTAAAGGALTGAAIGSVIPVVGTAVGAAVGGVIGGGAELYKVLTKPDGALRKKFGEWGTNIWEGTKTACSALGSGLESVGGFAKDFLVGGPLGVISNMGIDFSGMMTSAWESVSSLASGFSEFVSGAWAGVTGTVSTAWEGAKSLASSAWEGTKSVASDAWEGAKSIGSSALETVGDIAGGALDMASSAGTAVLDFATSWLPSFDVGSQMITETGAAIVHAGEAIVPGEALAGIGAVGEKWGMGDWLSKAFDMVTNPLKGIVGMVAEGAFSKGEEKEASMLDWAGTMGKLMFPMASPIISGFEALKGWFSGDSAAETGAAKAAEAATAAATSATTNTSEVTKALEGRGEYGMGLRTGDGVTQSLIDISERSMENFEQQSDAAIKEYVDTYSASAAEASAIQEGMFAKDSVVDAQLHASESKSQEQSWWSKALEGSLKMIPGIGNLVAGGGLISDMMSGKEVGFSDVLGAIFPQWGAMQDISSALSTSLDSKSSESLKSADMLESGLFDKTNIVDAQMQTDQALLSSYEQRAADTLTTHADMMEKGLFEKGTVNEADMQHMVEKMSGVGAGAALAGIYAAQKPKGSGDVSKAMYGTEDDDYLAATNMVFGGNVGGAASSATNYMNAYGGVTPAAAQIIQAYEASRAAKGAASTTYFPTEDAEAYVAQHHEASKPNGPSALIPGLDAILQYMETVQSAKYNEMIAELQAIRMRMGQQTVPLVGTTGNTPANSRSGVKQYAKEKVNPHWSGLQAGAHTQQQNATGDVKGKGTG